MTLIFNQSRNGSRILVNSIEISKVGVNPLTPHMVAAHEVLLDIDLLGQAKMQRIKPQDDCQMGGSFAAKYKVDGILEMTHLSSISLSSIY